MDIRVLVGDHDKLIDTLHNRIDKSRFTVDRIYHKSKNVIKIETVRLRESKPYCGNHPAACDVEGGRKGKYLEGADWVEWNDLVNDVCDELFVSANVRTSVCIIRKDTRRRTNYDMEYRHFSLVPQWVKDEPDYSYEDYCGRVAPDSEYPYGTPGLYLRGV